MNTVIQRNKLASHYLMLANTFYEEIKPQLDIAENFEVGTDRWIVGLLSKILETTVITYSELERELSRFEKGYLLIHIENLTIKPTQELGEHIQGLKGIEIDVKIAELKEKNSLLKEENKSLYEYNLLFLNYLISKRKEELRKTQK